MEKRPDSKIWDDISADLQEGQPFNELLAEQYARVHTELIHRWCPELNGLRILKTDLFAEALCPSRAFLWNIMKQNTDLIALDISPRIASRAANNILRHEYNSRVSTVACDVRNLPFNNNFLDLIISDSTLDHFDREEDIEIALKELVRILKSGGTMIITLDNKGNITDPLFELWKTLHLSSFYIGKTYTIKQMLSLMEKLNVEVLDYTAILHNPRFFTKAILSVCGKLTGHKLDNRMRKWLADMDGWETRRTRYLTAQFIAVKAMKK